ncbi:MAG: S8 family serine peptidase [Cytophagales bacterium]|nr:S8 family serine peptidase [Cytophagales bacterium]
MYTYNYGGKNGTTHFAEVAEDLVVVRTKENMPLASAITAPKAKSLLSQMTPIVNFEDAGVTVLQCRQSKNRLLQMRDQARTAFKSEKDIRFAGKALRAPDGNPIVYTENFFVKFQDELESSGCEQIIANHNLTIKKKLGYAANAYFIEAPEGTGLKIFQIARDLLDEERVELCHPEIIQKAGKRAVGEQQWHLKQTSVNGNLINAHVNVEPAWNTAKGGGTVIAVIDDGVDIDHEEFGGADKVVAPRDATENSDDPRPKDRFYPENHGTACAGVACANGNHGASGVAPEAKLMPIRLVSNLGSLAEADAFQWAAEHGADVISCSWGPVDGKWWDPNDAAHDRFVALPDSTRLAIDYAITSGRNGKGCVITRAAGNGNERVENDGYASYDPVVAVAACNDTNARSVYSDYGASVWCAFPSNDIGYAPFNHPDPLSPGIWTTDRAGAKGYNPGVLDPGAEPPGDDHGHYTETFGGTSSACPGIAGICALILSANPDLRWDEVKDILRASATQIDPENGSYNSEGHSPFYGYGRPDAALAVQLAKNRLDGNGENIEALQLEANAGGQLSGSGDVRYFSVRISSRAGIFLDGPGGIDFDLYVKRGAPPTTEDYDQRAYTPGPDETITVEPESPGEYFIMARSYRGSGNFSLKVSLV